MAGGKNRIHEHPRANTNGFDKRPDDATKGGRPPSIRKQIKDVLGSNGLMTIPSSQVKQINQNGSIEIDVPTDLNLAMQLTNWAMSKKGNESLKAIQVIMEQIDGKPKQEIEQTQIPPIQYDYSKLSDTDFDKLVEILDKAKA